MNQPSARSGLQLRSTIKRSGELELSLVDTPVPEPAPDEVVITVEAAPINPSDIGLLFGAADMSTATASGSADRPVVTAKVPDKLMRAMAGRLDQSMPVGNEGAGIVVEAGASPPRQALLGRTVAAIGGAMYSQLRCVKVDQCLPLPAGTKAADGASCFVNPLTAPRHGRDDAHGRPQGARPHGGGVEPRPDAEPDLHRRRHRPRQHRAQARAGKLLRELGARLRLQRQPRRPSSTS
jgi:NADPH:quinone reductase-like Zn-dependent oxidoreductase